MFQPVPETLDLDLLVLPETNLILFASVIEPLRVVNRIVGRDLYRWTIFSPDGRPAETRSGISIPAAGAFRPDKESHPLFILSSHNWDRYTTPALKRVLSKTARHRSMVAGIEAGGWLLAEVGLLASVRATTHWEDFDDFTRAYPEIDMVRERFVIDGKRITTGGSLPTVDLMLEIIRRRQGYSLALEVSRQFIYEQDGRRSEETGMPSTGSMRVVDQRVAQAVTIMEETVEEPLLLARLARRVGVSARHLQELFRDGIGVPPHVHYMAIRLNAARRKVIESKLPFADIALTTGFNSASAFARAYKAQFRESASETRKRLQG
ncbi:GlxA family transcriptional regulator [Rhizobium sp. YJ-22]|uniref:GlxA family transcriptional regulator n=1 Tax=Rhizobium sp. YJ-22 TaxID=3037556 RepID=UPI002412272F|nr:GlxA family transcriptional regulator [Rhizobium sp. YJ-22]MDG3575933.1 GlxA family transcriptional regulator [Rhizobium sp. YJ-22]